ncbi:Lar family restriction alleviation protein [Methylorubrum sp. B1-46]|uniref:Lar family restriction alleviation protein n=1 Tax=Methylorubrum sp. B1-46 TaxID=2897334 RepID=UPI00351CBDEB
MVEGAEPCPFCRGTNLSCRPEDIDGWAAQVACHSCDAVGPLSEFKYDDQQEATEDAVRMWNRRQ